ncbi:MAG: MATE family efflux transporter, partial [Nannocystaceae bacterium]
LAAASLGVLWTWGTLVMGSGLVFGIDPVVSQAHGAGARDTFGRAVQRGIVIAVLACLPIAGLWFLTEDALLLFGQSPKLARMAHEYVQVQYFGLPAFLIYILLRQSLQAREITAPAMWVVLLANLLNVVLNALLIYGVSLGPVMLEPLGLRGAGIATTLTRLALALGLIMWIWRGRLFAGVWPRWRWREVMDPHGLTEILRHGVPLSFQFSFEMWAFQISTLLAGNLGAIDLASHTVVLNLASLSFMVPLGIGMAATTRVGNLLGAGKPRAAQRSAWVALGLGGGVMAASALLFIVLKDILPTAYTNSAAVVAAASALLPIAAAFQLFDGIQVVGSGILRAMGKTTIAASFHLIAFYGLALPLAYWLTFTHDLGVPGLWWGLTLGLGILSVLFVGFVAFRGPAHAKALIATARDQEHPRS